MYRSSTKLPDEPIPFPPFPPLRFSKQKTFAFDIVRGKIFAPRISCSSLGSVLLQLFASVGRCNRLWEIYSFYSVLDGAKWWRWSLAENRHDFEEFLVLMARGKTVRVQIVQNKRGKILVRRCWHGRMIFRGILNCYLFVRVGELYVTFDRERICWQCLTQMLYLHRDLCRQGSSIN